MDLGPSMSYQVRVTKRKLRKGRFFTFLLLLALLISAALTWFNVGIFKGVNEFLGITADQKTLAATQVKNDLSTKPAAQDNETSNLKDYTSLKTDLEGYIKDLQGHYGIHVIDLESKTEFGINNTEEFIAASTVKVPINLYLYKKIEEGSIKPTETITYTRKDREGGTGYIQTQELGTTYTIRDLAKLSIQVSDNVAANMLIGLLGKQNYKNYMKQLGGTIVNDNNTSSPKDMALYMQKVYEFQNSNKALGGELVDFLETTAFNDRLPKLLPSNVKVAHKIGNYWDEDWGSVFNDVGIVYSEHPYVISVMSRNIDEGEGDNAIASISKKVYDFMSTPAKKD